MESSSANLQERKRLNEEIERTFIFTATAARNIQIYNQTERGISVFDLYERFFSEFSLLIILTSDLPQMRSSKDAVERALSWVKIKPKLDTEPKMLARLAEGFEVFMAYKKVLSEQGVISLPSR
jgi:hypothetical protein